MTNDGIVIPKKGLFESLKNPTDPTIPVMGSNRDDQVVDWNSTLFYST